MGSEIKHTPGPWQVMPEEQGLAYIRIRGTQLGERYKIADVVRPVYDGVHESEVEESRTNARLIAAAPDLLAACKAFTKWDLDSDTPAEAHAAEGERVGRMIQAAYFKAIGEATC